MYFIKTHVAEAGGMIETEYFETFFSEFLNDSRQLVASSSLVLENIIEQPEAKNSSFLFYCKTQNWFFKASAYLNMHFWYISSVYLR